MITSLKLPIEKELWGYDLPGASNHKCNPITYSGWSYIKGHFLERHGKFSKYTDAQTPSLTALRWGQNMYFLKDPQVIQICGQA